MKGADDAKDFGPVIAVLCALRHWNQAKLVEESGIHKDSISDYWYGLKSPSRKNRERIAAAFGVSYLFLERLVPILRGIRCAYEAAISGGQSSKAAAEDASRLEEGIAGAFMQSMAPTLLQLDQLDALPCSPAEARAWAAARWAALESLSPGEQSKIAEVLQGDERSWALAARISEAGAAAAPHNATEAQRLDRLAAGLLAAAPLSRG
jgi:transcriptional regulator with XRE-family HTH domain